MSKNSEKNLTMFIDIENETLIVASLHVSFANHIEVCEVSIVIFEIADNGIFVQISNAFCRSNELLSVFYGVMSNNGVILGNISTDFLIGFMRAITILLGGILDICFSNEFLAKNFSGLDV